MFIPITPAYPGFGVTASKGMTVQDYFAAAALQGILGRVAADENLLSSEDAARKALEYADAFVERLEPERQKKMKQDRRTALLAAVLTVCFIFSVALVLILIVGGLAWLVGK